MTIKRIDNVAFVVEDLEARVVGKIARYLDVYRLCYLRGPDGLLFGLAEELRP